MIIGSKPVGIGLPVYIVAEIGINHNGSTSIAEQLIDVAAEAGVDAVKLQKRAPRLSTPRKEWDVLKQGTPWGDLSYIEYRERMEFGIGQHLALRRYAGGHRLDYILSVWDTESLQAANALEVDAIKIPSAMLTNSAIIEGAARVSIVPTILSTGMSTMEQIDMAVYQWGEAHLGRSDRLALLHCTSTYPCPPEELNLNMIHTLRERFAVPIGYSGHETGLAPTLAAIALGAEIIERHITLDRAMWGSDHAASIEPQGLRKLVRDIRLIEQAMGDGIKQVYDSELPAKRKLRGTV